MEHKNNQIKALCDYLLGYWHFEVDEDNDDELFNEYFIDKYNVDLYSELRIGQHSWRRAHIELRNLLCDDSELSQLLLEMISLSSSVKTERIIELIEELYKKI